MRKENIKSLVLTSSDIVTLPLGSYVYIGGQGYFLAQDKTVNRTVSGIGGLDATVQANTTYYVYAVVSAGAVQLIASASFVNPSGYTNSKMVGEFFIGSNSLIFMVTPWSNGSGLIATPWTAYTPVIGASSGALTNYSLNFVYKIVGDKLSIKGNLTFSTTVVGTWATPTFSYPNGISTTGSQSFGKLRLLDSGANDYINGMAIGNSSFVYIEYSNALAGSGANITQSAPFIFTINDNMEFVISDITILGRTSHSKFN